MGRDYTMQVQENFRLYQAITNCLLFSAGLLVCDWLKWTKKIIAQADSCIIAQELDIFEKSPYNLWTTFSYLLP